MPFEKAAAFTLRKMNIVCDLRQGNRFGIGGLDERENVFQAADGIRAVSYTHLPVRLPSLPTTRWQGTKMEILLCPTA